MRWVFASLCAGSWERYWQESWKPGHHYLQRYGTSIEQPTSTTFNNTIPLNAKTELLLAPLQTAKDTPQLPEISIRFTFLEPSLVTLILRALLFTANSVGSS